MGFDMGFKVDEVPECVDADVPNKAKLKWKEESKILPPPKPSPTFKFALTFSVV